MYQQRLIRAADSKATTFYERGLELGVKEELLKEFKSKYIEEMDSEGQ